MATVNYGMTLLLGFHVVDFDNDFLGPGGDKGYRMRRQESVFIFPKYFLGAMA